MRAFLLSKENAQWPSPKIDDFEIPVVNEYKFLGIIFDEKL